ncbi:Ig-like domain-containing protein [Mesotoga sp.]|uniref:Ig-like domain-containing protein n=1 Tax=Mesotoga sp. TaxID=2053577 RepID=UPI00345EA762
MIKKGFFRLTLLLTLVIFSTVSCLDVSVRLLKAIHMLSVEEGDTLEIDLMSYVFPAHIEESIEFEILRGVGEIEDTKYVFSPDYDSSGVYEVELKASSSNQTDTREFSVKVLDKNRAPSIEIPDQSISTEENLDLDLAQFSTDPDGDTLSFSLVSGVGGIQGSNYTFSSSEVYLGENEVTISVSDGKGGSDSASFSITVFNSNEAPQLGVPEQNIKEGESLSIDLLEYSNDPDGDALSFELISGVGAVTGTSYVYTSDYESEGVYQITIGVVDTKGATNSDQFQLTVINENRKPSEPTAPLPEDGETDVSTNTSLLWSCADLDDDELTYDVYLWKTSEPVLVASRISEKSFKPDSLEPGTHYLWKVEASDGEDTVVGPVWEFTTQIPPVILEIDSKRELIVSPKVIVNEGQFSIPVTYVSEKGESLVVRIEPVQEFDIRKPVGNDVRLEFIGWNNGETLTQIEVLMDDSRKILAEFSASYYLNITTSARYEEEILGKGWHDEGTAVEVTAPKIEGYTFRSWDLNETYGIVCGEVIVVDMDGPVNLVANYTHDCP